MDQLRIQCGRGWDHEAHTWLSDPSRFCPGKVAKPLAHAGDAGVASWEQDEPGAEREAVQAAPEAPEGDGGVEHPCGDYPAPCNCDDPTTHNGHGGYPHKKGHW